MILLGGLGAVAQAIVSRTGATRANASFLLAVRRHCRRRPDRLGGSGVGLQPRAESPGRPLPFTVLIATCAGLAILFCVLALRRGFERLDTPLVYALAFLATLAGALVNGLLLAMPVLQQHLGSNTRLLHRAPDPTMTALLGLAFMAGLHDVWPRLTGRAFSEVAGKAAAVVILISLHLVSLPLDPAGRSGAPFRAIYVDEYMIMNVMAFAGTTLLLAGLAAAVINLIAGPVLCSLLKPQRCGGYLPSSALKRTTIDAKKSGRAGDVIAAVGQHALHVLPFHPVERRNARSRVVRPSAQQRALKSGPRRPAWSNSRPRRVAPLPARRRCYRIR